MSSSSLHSNDLSCAGLFDTASHSCRASGKALCFRGGRLGMVFVGVAQRSRLQVKIVTSEIDSRVDENFVVVPGVGEFGDRYFCE